MKNDRSPTDDGTADRFSALQIKGDIFFLAPVADAKAKSAPRPEDVPLMKALTVAAAEDEAQLRTCGPSTSETSPSFDVELHDNSLRPPLFSSALLRLAKLP